MAVAFALPGALSDVAGWAPRVEVDGGPASVGEALASLRHTHPAIHARVMTESGEVRPHVNLFVNATEIRHTGGLETPLDDGSEIVVLPSVSGG